MRVRASTIASAIFVVTFLLHDALHSPWLDDYDSVQFALGMQTLDLTVHQPHPPGYAAYIYMARAIDVVLSDRQASLSLLSTVGGAASVALTFLIGARLVSMPAGLLASAILLFIPLHMQQSLVAMTDVVVVPFLLGALLCLHTAASRSDRVGTVAVAAAGVLMGWGVGVRPQWVFLFGAAGVTYVLAARHVQRAAVLVVSGVLATLAWLVPISIGHGGFMAYLALAKGQYSAHPGDRAHFSPSEILQFSHWIVNRWEVSAAVLGIMAVAAATAIRRARRPGPSAPAGTPGASMRRRVELLAGWLLLAAAMSLLFHPLRLPRSALPLLPPLALLLGTLIADGIASLPARWHQLAAAVPALAALGLMADTSIQQGMALRTSVPPPIQGARFIEREFDPSSTLLVARRNQRHWEYYIPAFRRRVHRDESPFRIAGAFGPHEHVITDFPIFNIPPTRTVQFTRSEDVYFDFPTVTLHQYDNERVMLAARVGAYAMTEAGFWIAEGLSGSVRSPGDTERQVAMRLRSGFDKSRRAVVRVDDRDVWSGVIGPDQQTVLVPLPVGIGWVPFELVSLDGCRPETAPDGTPGRCLSLQFRQLSVMPARYRLDTRVEFGYDEVGHAFLREGWSDPEDWGVWALGTGAAIELPLDHRPTHDLRLRLDGYWYIQPGQAPLEMALLANGRVVEERTIPLGERDNPSFRIPASAIGEDARLRLELRFDNPASPAAIGQSDTRVLGLALRALRLFEEP